MDTVFIKDLAKVYGWLDLGPQKNEHMLSFRREKSFLRLNFYTNTMTATLQRGNLPCKTYRDVQTPLELGEVLSMKV